MKYCNARCSIPAFRDIFCLVIFTCFISVFSISQNKTELEKFRFKADSLVFKNYTETILEIEYNRKFSNAYRISTEISTNDTLDKKVRNIYEYYYTYTCSIENSVIYYFTVIYNKNGQLVDYERTNNLLNSLMEANNKNEFDSFKSAKEVLVNLGLKKWKFKLSIIFKKNEFYWLILPKSIDKKSYGYSMKLNRTSDIELISPDQLLLEYGP